MCMVRVLRAGIDCVPGTTAKFPKRRGIGCGFPRRGALQSRHCIRALGRTLRAQPVALDGRKTPARSRQLWNHIWPRVCDASRRGAWRAHARSGCLSNSVLSATECDSRAGVHANSLRSATENGLRCGGGGDSHFAGRCSFNGSLQSRPAPRLQP
jgi:hypothetical protein